MSCWFSIMLSWIYGFFILCLNISRIRLLRRIVWRWWVFSLRFIISSIRIRVVSMISFMKSIYGFFRSCR